MLLLVRGEWLIHLFIQSINRSINHCNDGSGVAIIIRLSTYMELLRPGLHITSPTPIIVQHHGQIYLFWFPKTLSFVSNSADIKSVLMAVQTLGTTGTGGQTHLILARLDTEVSVF